VNSCVPQTLPIVAPLPENIWPAAFQARENRVIYNFLLLISQKNAICEQLLYATAEKSLA
jgi:hypothetical protein